jgi:hypothetical protein
MSQRDRAEELISALRHAWMMADSYSTRAEMTNSVKCFEEYRIMARNHRADAEQIKSNLLSLIGQGEL